MVYTICNETRNRMRIRTVAGHISENEEEVLRYALGNIHCVTAVRIYRATGGIEIRYQDDREAVVKRLDALRYQNVTLFARELETQISSEEVERRHLTPELKRKLRTRILIECAADVFLPMPVQVAYHVYQLLTLKELF